MNRFDYYEIVRIRKEGRHNGAQGILIGVSEEDGVLHGYSVFLDTHAIFFLPEELEPTGGRISKEDWEAGNLPPARPSPA